MKLGTFCLHSRRNRKGQRKLQSQRRLAASHDSPHSHGTIEQQDSKLFHETSTMQWKTVK